MNDKLKVKRTVILCEHTPKPGWGQRFKLYAFGTQALANALGMSRSALYSAVARGDLNPRSLKSICSFYHARVETRKIDV